MSEFALIEKYCTNLGVSHDNTVLSVGDDAAIISLPSSYDLVVSVDSIVEGTHFLKGLAPELIAHKLLAVNLSDMAAMGAKPRWLTLATCMPRFDEDWVARFTSTINQVASRFDVEVIGGDTTEGPRSFTANIMGLLPTGKALTRNGAKPGDKLYCSGTLGDAALALTRLLGEQDLPDDIFKDTLPSLHVPEPRVKLGQRLLGLVTACIDLSDGLVGDAVHLSNRSGVTVEVETSKIPLSDAYKKYMSSGGFLRYALAGGDDYELLFTAAEERETELMAVGNELGISITQIGQISARSEDPVVTLHDGVPTNLKLKPFQHFF
ncbi:MAG: thiamine-phosphate kinase [Gammaproteobacteria bacterium]|nr:thiamine-phosphate kinase [Gammaproteobacteria bacterium]